MLHLEMASTWPWPWPHEWMNEDTISRQMHPFVLHGHNDCGMIYVFARFYQVIRRFLTELTIFPYTRMELGVQAIARALWRRVNNAALVVTPGEKKRTIIGPDSPIYAESWWANLLRNLNYTKRKYLRNCVDKSMHIYQMCACVRANSMLCHNYCVACPHEVRSHASLDSLEIWWYDDSMRWQC